MGCKICGRNSCCSTFHSIEEQQEYDDKYYEVEERAFERGRKEGYDEGHKDGYQEGFDDGHQEGYDKGVADADK